MRKTFYHLISLLMSDVIVLVCETKQHYFLEESEDMIICFKNWHQLTRECVYPFIPLIFISLNYFKKLIC